MANNFSFDGAESSQPQSGRSIAGLSDTSAAQSDDLPAGWGQTPMRESESAMDFRQLYRRFRLRMLIVDHDLARVEALKDLIDQELYGVDVAHSGEAAWEMICHNLENPIDIVISAQELPDISGLILCQRLKSNPEHTILQNTYFVALLSPERQQLRHFAIEAGVNEIWYLPWQLPDITLRLEMAWRYAILQRSIYRANYRAKVQQQLLSAMSLSDPISGLPNRYAMNASLPNLPLGNENQRKWLGVLRIKISGLTEIKQQHGSRIYQDALRAIAGRLQNNCEPQSWLFHDQSHEMLCVTLHNSPAEATSLGQRLVEIIHNHPIAVSYRLLLKVTVYIGGSTILIPSEVLAPEAMQLLLEELVAEANQALKYLLAELTKPANPSDTETSNHFHLRMIETNRS